MNGAAALPRRIRIEASSACQLRCPSCPTGKGDLKHSHVGTGLLKPDEFRAMLERLPFVEIVELSNWGEVFLNPHLPDILRIAWERSVAVTLSNGVNLNHVSERTLHSMVRYGVRHITVSIDGASDTTYRVYRVRGSFERVIRNVIRINELKAELRSLYPSLTWQFVVFGHNEHEISLAREMAESLGMTFAAKLSWDEGYSPIQNVDRVRRDAGWTVTSRRDFQNTKKRSYVRDICYQLWNNPQINFDGNLLGCCVNTWGDFGNILRDTWAEVWDGPKITMARLMLMGRALPAPEVPCATCSKFKEIQEHQAWISAEEVI